MTTATDQTRLPGTWGRTLCDFYPAARFTMTTAADQLRWGRELAKILNRGISDSEIADAIRMAARGGWFQDDDAPSVNTLAGWIRHAAADRTRANSLVDTSAELGEFQRSTPAQRKEVADQLAALIRGWMTDQGDAKYEAGWRMLDPKRDLPMETDEYYSVSAKAWLKIGPMAGHATFNHMRRKIEPLRGKAAKEGVSA